MANPIVTFSSNWTLASGSMSDFSLGVGSVTATTGTGLGLIETSRNWSVIKKIVVTTNRPLGYCAYYNGSYNQVVPTTVQDGNNYISTLTYPSLPSNTQYLYIETSPMGGTYSDLRVYDSNDNIINMVTPTYTLTINPTPADADVRFEIEGTTVTEDVYNINTTSSTIVNNNGVLSGFTTSQYAYLPEYFAPNSADTWEMQLKFTYTYVNSYQRLCGAINNTSVAQIVLGMGDDSGFRLQCWASSNGTQWNISSGTIGSTVFQNGTTYWLKVRFTGTQYQFDLSTDGENFTREATITSSTHLNNNNSNFLLGNAELSGYFRGTIDLNECYIKIDDELWWEGKTVTYPNPVTVEEGTDVTYIVSKTGYTTQSDTVTVNEDTVLNVVLSKPSSINLGNTPINKIYLGNTEINKLYLGDTLVYGTAGNNFTVKTDTSTCSLNSGNLTDFAGGSSTIILDVINQNTPKVKLSLRSPSVLYSDIKTISFTTSLSGNTRYLGAFWGYYDASGTYVYKGEAPSVSAGVMTYSNVSIPQDATGILICTNNYGANTTGVTNTVSNLQILDANGNSLL